MKKVTTAAIALMQTFNVLAADLWKELTEAETSLRFEKNLLDTPLPVSVITSEDIVAFGIESIVDAISLFPGVSLARNEYFDISLSYHELSPVSPRRMQVLIDNTTVLQSGLQSVSWWNLPISIDDVERIELTRAPGTISHSSNSFNGTIHIKTKRKTERRVSSAKYSSDGLSKRFTARYQDKLDSSLVALTASSVKSSGFNGLADDSENNSISLSYDYSNEGISLGATFKRSQGNKQGRAGEYSPTAEKVAQDIELYAISAEYALNDESSIYLSLNNSKWHQFESLKVTFPLVVTSDSLRKLHTLDGVTARAIVYEGFQPSPDYRYYDLYLDVLQYGAATGLFSGETYKIVAPLEVDENRKTIHTSYQFQNEAWDLAFGYSFLEDLNFSPVYLLDYTEHRQTTRQLNASVSYSRDNTTVSSSFMNESISLGNKHNQARLSGLHRIGDSSSVRASVSKSYRIPSLWEEKGGFRFFGEFEENPYGITSGVWFQEQISAGGLMHEDNTYTELGYHYASLIEQTEFDVSLFFSRYEGLIIDQMTIESFAPANDHDVDLYGVEAELTTTLAGHNLKVFGSVADSRVNRGDSIIDDVRGYSLDDAGFTAQFKLNVLHSYQVSDLLNLTSEFGMIRGASQLENNYIKFGFAKALKVLGQSQIKTTGFVRYSDNPLIASPFIREQVNPLNNLTIGGSVKISF